MFKFLLNASGLTLTLLLGLMPNFLLPVLAQSQNPLIVPRISDPVITGPNKVTPPDDPSLPKPSGDVAPGDAIPEAEQELERANLDDITNDPGQLTTWVCNHEDKSVVVEIKEISFWQQLTEDNKNWQCSQNLTEIPAQKPTFSCQPTDTIGLITVYWLEGKGGEQQMNAWMTALANNKNMVCTTSTTNKYWE